MLEQQAQVDPQVAEAKAKLDRDNRMKRHAALLKIQGYVFDAMMATLELPDWSKEGGDGKEMFEEFSGLLQATRKKVSTIYTSVLPEVK